MYLENLVVDALEPQRLGRFWETALDGQRLTDEPDGFETRLDVGDDAALDPCFQPVQDPPSGPSRFHLDLLAVAS
jgi:Glyoxalase-like domain